MCGIRMVVGRSTEFCAFLQSTQRLIVLGRYPQAVPALGKKRSAQSRFAKGVNDGGVAFDQRRVLVVPMRKMEHRKLLQNQRHAANDIVRRRFFRFEQP